ncbi:hypothetical protein AVEN_163328-1 [Araneus ventricosus]|uniref:Uncharacterized protein n=1 Tax=Araneus ventricosus TaxID=182803 RepID=A0A4Y2TH24_ARAVE|nr:hypothetical protein AVEN_163328-1 [Araneus ventricosus]
MNHGSQRVKPHSHGQWFEICCLKSALSPVTRLQRIVVACGVLESLDPSGEMSVNARTPNASRSTDEDLSTVPIGCCRLCKRFRNSAAD